MATVGLNRMVGNVSLFLRYFYSRARSDTGDRHGGHDASYAYGCHDSRQSERGVCGV